MTRTTTTTTTTTTIVENTNNESVVNNNTHAEDDKRREQVEAIIEHDFSYFTMMIDKEYIQSEEVKKFEDANSEEALKYKQRMEQIEKDRDFMEYFVEEFIARLEVNPMYRVLKLDQVLKWAKDAKLPEYSAYEDSVKQDDPVKRTSLLTKIYKNMIDFHLRSVRDQREKERKERITKLEQEELKKKKELEKRNATNTRSRGKNVVEAEDDTKSEDMVAEEKPPVVEDKDPRPELYFVLKGYPRNVLEIEEFNKEMKFHAFVLLEKDTKRGPPAKAPPDESDKKKKQDKKSAKPQKKKQNPKDKGVTEIIPEPLSELLIREQLNLQESNRASVARDVLFIRHSVVEYTYDAENQKFDDGRDVDMEIDRIASVIDSNIDMIVQHSEGLKPQKSTKYVRTADIPDSNAIHYYNVLMKSVPEASQTVPVSLYCAIQQLVRQEEENLGVNKDDKKLIEFNENMTLVMDDILAKLDRGTVVSKADERKPTNSIQLLPYGNMRHWNILYPNTMVQSVKLSDIENRYSKMFPMFSSQLRAMIVDHQSSSTIPPVTTPQERGSRLTQLHYYLTKGAPNQNSEQLRKELQQLTPDIVEKELAIFKFEELINQHSPDYKWDFSERCIKEEFDSETFIQTLRDFTLLNSFTQYSAYYDIEDSILLIYWRKIPQCLFTEYSFVNNFCVKPYLMEKCKSVQSDFTLKTKQEFNQRYENYQKVLQQYTQSEFDEEEKNGEIVLPDIVDTRPKSKLEKRARLTRTTLQSNGLVNFVFEGPGAELTYDSIDFFPTDGSVIHLSSHSSTYKKITCNVEKDGIVFGFKSKVVQNADTFTTVSYFSCSFKDESTLFIGKRDETVTEVSISSTQDLYITQLSSGEIVQLYPQQPGDHDQNFGTGFQGTLANKADKMHISMHLEAQNLEIYDSSTNSLKKVLCRELFRTTVVTGQVQVNYDNGVVEVLFPNGETHVRSSDGFWVKTNMKGERIVEGIEGKRSKLPSIHAANNIDAETGATVFSREDLVMKIQYPDGSYLVQFTNGIRIWSYFEKREEADDDDDEDDKQSPANTLLIEQPGFSTVRIDTLKDERVIHTETPDGTLISCKPDTTRNIRLVKEGHQFILDSQTEIVSVETHSLIQSGSRPDSDNNPKYYYGTYSVRYAKGGLKTIDPSGNEFVIVATGQSFIRYHSGPHESQKLPHEDPVFDEGPEKEEVDPVGLSPVVVEGQCPETSDELRTRIHPPRLFMLRLSDDSGVEFTTKEATKIFFEDAKQDPAVSLTSDFADTRKRVITHTYLRQYGYNSAVLKSEVEKYRIPRGIVPLFSRRKVQKDNIFIHRKLIEYPQCEKTLRKCMGEGLEKWQQWYSEQEATYKGVVDEVKSDEQIQNEEEVQDRIQQMAQKLDQSETEPSESESVIYHNQDDDEEAKSAATMSRATSHSTLLSEKESIHLMKSKTPDILIPSNLPPRPLYWNKTSGQKALQQIAESASLQTIANQKARSNVPSRVERVENSTQQNDATGEKLTDVIVPPGPREPSVKIDVSDAEDQVKPEEEGELESESKFLEQLPNRFAGTGNTLSQKNVILKKLVREPAQALPNNRTIDKQSRAVKTVSMLKDVQDDSAYLQVYPSSMNFGYLAIGEIYRCSAMITNSGHLPGRFFIKHSNKSAWTSSYINARNREQNLVPSESEEEEYLDDNIVKILCKNGPIAPGMSVKVEIEIHAAVPQSLSHTVQIRTEQHFISLPIRAVIVSQQEFVKQGYQLSKRVKIVNLNPVVNKL